MHLLMFWIGLMVGGLVGVTAMCLFTVSGQASRREEEQWKR